MLKRKASDRSRSSITIAKIAGRFYVLTLTEHNAGKGWFQVPADARKVVTFIANPDFKGSYLFAGLDFSLGFALENRVPLDREGFPLTRIPGFEYCFETEAEARLVVASARIKQSTEAQVETVDTLIRTGDWR